MRFHVWSRVGKYKKKGVSWPLSVATNDKLMALVVIRMRYTSKCLWQIEAKLANKSNRRDENDLLESNDISQQRIYFASVKRFKRNGAFGRTRFTSPMASMSEKKPIPVRSSGN